MNGLRGVAPLYTLRFLIELRKFNFASGLEIGATDFQYK